MNDAIRQLQQIKGVGEVLAKRLVEAGFDTLQRVAAATEQELAAVKGLLPGAIPAVLAQARELAGTSQIEADEKSLAEMLENAERLRSGVSSLVLKLRDQHLDSEDGKSQRALRKEVTRVLATLERVEASLSEQLRRLGKKLAKADAALTNVAQDDLEALTKGLRQTRKSIDKIVRP
ncbi:MAG: helix-hairpin-helix domain-containing protein [Desulfuromonadales bacterium]